MLTTIMLMAAALLALVTWRALVPLPVTLPPPAKTTILQALARDGTPLNRTVRGRFNRLQRLHAWQIPHLLRTAFIVSEDKRYWHHGGVDWPARFAALWANLRAGHIVRGASTIGEQVARILAPRPRTYWSHWVAGFDADRLLRRFGHARVLTFYLNQVPFGGQRRGVAQAGAYYFGRSLDALSPAQQLALAVLVRSPQGYDPRRHPYILRRAVDALGARMHARGDIGSDELAAIRRSSLTPGQQRLAVDAGPFVVYAMRRARAQGLNGPRIRTTLDADLQRFVQRVLRKRVRDLHPRGVRNAAALVIDNATGAVRAWAVAPAGNPYAIDPVLTPRQPGSTLKPFIYGLAMQRLGWRSDTVIEDTPLTEPVGAGVHRYRNYSGRHYGPVSLRYALANSLNIPAIKTAQAVGVPHIMTLLHALGFSTFDQGADVYGPAVALGDGPVRLFDLVQAYAVLARRGRFVPLRVLADAPQPPPRRVLPATVTSLLADILSDPAARAAEFSNNSVLDLPRPTAVKTGTSSDARDTWTLGFDNRYTVGLWMGRLSGGATNHLTGSTGPAPVLRQIFAHLRSHAPYAGLWRSPRLTPYRACEWIGGTTCFERDDWRLPGTRETARTASGRIRFARPLPGETLAIDPRVPRSAQRYRFRLDTGRQHVTRVQWILDGKPLAATSQTRTQWMLQPGPHKLSARVWMVGNRAPETIRAVRFSVLPATPVKQTQPVPDR